MITVLPVSPILTTQLSSQNYNTWTKEVGVTQEGGSNSSEYCSQWGLGVDPLKNPTSRVNGHPGNLEV